MRGKRPSKHLNANRGYADYITKYFRINPSMRRSILGLCAHGMQLSLSIVGGSDSILERTTFK